MRLPGHQTVGVHGIDVDADIAGVVKALLDIGLETTCSCQGVAHERNAYVQFRSLDHAVVFLRSIQHLTWCQLVATPPCDQPDAYGDWQWMVEWDPENTALIDKHWSTP